MVSELVEDKPQETFGLTEQATTVEEPQQEPLEDILKKIESKTEIKELDRKIDEAKNRIEERKKTKL